MGNGSGCLKLHFLSEESPVVCLAAEARAQGWGVPGGHRGLSMGTGQSDVEPCLGGCQPGQGINRSQYPLTLPSPPQGPRNGPRVPVSHGRRKIDLAVLGGGAHIVIVAPTHSASGWGGAGKLALIFAGREQYVLTTGAGLRLPNSQPAWGDNI